MNLKNITLLSGKIIAVLLSWMLLSPLFFYFSKKWWPRQKAFRWGVFILSPFSFLIMLLLGIAGYYGYNRYDRAYYYNQKRLAQITNAPIPSFRVIERKQGGSSFVGDYRDYKLIQFKNDLTPDFYNHLDSLCNLDENYWSVEKGKKDTIYSYSRIWGNNLPVPSGISNFDGFLNFKIKKGLNEVNLEYGVW